MAMLTLVDGRMLMSKNCNLAFLFITCINFVGPLCNTIHYVKVSLEASITQSFIPAYSLEDICEVPWRFIHCCVVTSSA